MAAVVFGLLGLALLIFAVGGIMFLVAAFRRSMLWGLAVVFLPPAGLVFLVKHWPDVKISVLLHVIATVLAVAGALALPTLDANRLYEEQSASIDTDFRSAAPRGYRVSEQAEAPPGEEPGDDFEAEIPSDDLGEAGDFDDSYDVNEPAPVPTLTPTPWPTLAPAPQPTRPPPPGRGRTEIGRGTYPTSRLANHLGEYVILVLTDHREIRVRLDRVDENALRIAQRIGGGTMEYTIPLSDVTGFRPLQ